MKKILNIIHVIIPFLIAPIILAIAILIGLACTRPDSAQASEPPRQNQVYDSRTGGMDRFYDADYGVMCYRYNANSLSCVRVK